MNLTAAPSYSTATAESMLKAALEYVSSGFAVFPCCHPDAFGDCGCGRQHRDREVGKVPLTRHGLSDATQTVSGVQDLWSRFPLANIGIAVPAWCFVLDIDREKNGYESLARLQDRFGALPETRLVTTGGLGQHYYYRTDSPIRNTTRLAGLDGVDIRGPGGYVIAPPSRHRSGRRYVVSSIWDGPIAPAPAWLIDLCARGRGSTAGNSHGPNVIIEGERNDTLARDAGAMRRRGLSEEGILAALLVENRNRCQPPLSEEEVARIARSVARYTPVSPSAHREPAVRFRGGVRV